MTDEKESSADSEPDKKGAAVKFPPPAIFASLILLGAAIQMLWPLSLGIPCE